MSQSQKNVGKICEKKTKKKMRDVNLPKQKPYLKYELFIINQAFTLEVSIGLKITLLQGKILIIYEVLYTERFSHENEWHHCFYKTEGFSVNFDVF